MTALLVAVGLGTVTPTQVKMILQSRDPLGRHQTHVAPAQGLFLKSVLFGGLGELAAGSPDCAQESQGAGRTEAPGCPRGFRREPSGPKAGGLE